MKELVHAMLMAQTPFSVVSSSSGRAYSQKHRHHQSKWHKTCNTFNTLHQPLKDSTGKSHHLLTVSFPPTFKDFWPSVSSNPENLITKNATWKFTLWHFSGTFYHKSLTESFNQQFSPFSSEPTTRLLAIMRSIHLCLSRIHSNMVQVQDSWSRWQQGYTVLTHRLLYCPQSPGSLKALYQQLQHCVTYSQLVCRHYVTQL